MKRWLSLLILGGALVAHPLLAQEHEGSKAPESSGKEHEGGMEIWKVANFLLLVGILGYMIRKNGAPLLAARSREIYDGLAAGEKAQAEAQARAAAVAKRLSGLETEIAGMRDSARTERENEAERLRHDTNSEMMRIRQQVLMEIESSTKQARLEVQRHAARLAVDLAETKIRERMSPATQASLVTGFVADVSDPSRRGAR